MFGLNPPTDNLYKFFAIAGVAIVLVSIVATEAARDSYMTSLYDHDRDTEILVQEVQAIAHDEKIDVHAALVGRDKPWDTDEQSLYNKTDERLKKFSEDKPKLREIRKKNTELYWAKAKANYLQARAARYGNLQTAGFWVGSLVALVGFGLWYYKVQRYQDAMLKAGQKPPV